MNKKVKGFTLLELIVVMAIFSIILFGAMQLLNPVTKNMVQAEIHEESNAGVTGISNYLKNQLNTAEFITVYNEVPLDATGEVDTASIESKVSDFVNDHYVGIVKANSSPASPDYADGTIHVLLIDNRAKDVNDLSIGRGKISSIDYQYDFDPSNVHRINTPVLEEYAVNKAYYESYDFTLLFGSMDEEAFGNFDDEPEAYYQYSVLSDALKPENVAFSIRTSTVRKNEEYTSIYHFTTPLVNVLRCQKKGSSIPQGTYFTFTPVTELDADGNPVYQKEADGSFKLDANNNKVVATVPGILDITNPAVTTSYNSSAIIAKDEPGSQKNGYCIIYSYTSEINN